MATAQVNVWLAAQRGSLDDVLHAVDELLGDTALARMMLHRRRAIVATVVGEFLSRAGSSFLPYVEGRALQAPGDVASEVEIAKAAGEAAANISGAAPPLLFERALLAEAEGRRVEALSDLDELLEAYPGIPDCGDRFRPAFARGQRSRAGDPFAGISRKRANS